MKGLFSEFYGIIKTNRLSNRSYIISLSAKKLLSLQGSTNCYDLVEQYTLKLCSHGTPDKLQFRQGVGVPFTHRITLSVLNLKAKIEDIV